MNAIDVIPVNGHRLSAGQRAWTEDQLGLQPGAWDGYSSIPDEAVAKEAFGIVGNIHGYSAKVGKDIVALGNLLIRLKALLPHGQFMACVKAEFGWSQQWAHQLVCIAERFSNHNSSCDLPSSAKVLALLAQAGADDATVQQAAEERWSVAETKRRVSKASSPRQPQPTEALALTILRKGEVDRIREALALAERAQVVTPDQVMAEQRLRQLPKGSVIYGADADFHRMKDGSWIRLPHAGRVDIAPAAEPVVMPSVQLSNGQGELIDGSVAEPAEQRVSITRAAEILDCSESTIKVRLSPKQMVAKGPWRRNRYVVTKGGTGIVVIRREP